MNKKIEAPLTIKQEVANLRKLKYFIKIKLKFGKLDEDTKTKLNDALVLLNKYLPETSSTAEEFRGVTDALVQLPGKTSGDKVISDVVKSSKNIFVMSMGNETAEAQEYDNMILNQQLGNTPVESDVLHTSLTLAYESDSWGVQRICLDGVQNHLPSDSGGGKVWVQCMVDGKWIDVDKAKTMDRNKITAVRFVDDGAGFDSKNLRLLYSTKAGEEESKGQFGEGLKMLSAASLRQNLGMVVESRNWRAVPIAEEETLNNTRKNKVDTVQVLGFELDTFGDKTIQGSRTTFTTPSKEFLNELFDIRENVLELRPDYKPLNGHKARGELIDEPGKLFVKGIFIKNIDSVFSYNLTNVKTNRDRNELVGNQIENHIKNIVYDNSNNQPQDIVFLRRLLRGINDAYIKDSTKKYAEYDWSIWQSSNLSREAVKLAFYEEFGANAVVNTPDLKDSIYNESGVNKISYPKDISYFLASAGVKDEVQARPYFQDTVVTSLTSAYGGAWGAERIVLDAVQNHMPADSGGDFEVKFKTNRFRHWLPLAQMRDFQDGDIESIKISDHGRGYDYKLLGLFASSKEGDESTGKFGEGLKMLTLASLRLNQEIEVRSRDWVANPYFKDVDIDGKKFKQLEYSIKHHMNSVTKEKYFEDYEKSVTEFKSPNPEIIKEFRNLTDKILTTKSEKPVYASRDVELLNYSGGKIFVRNVIIPGNHNVRFAYHFKKFDIKNRDRSNISEDEIKETLKTFFRDVDSADVIRTYLLMAQQDADSRTDFLDFKIPFETNYGPLWVKVFRETFGGNTAIRPVGDMDFNAVHRAQHMGLKMISLPNSVYNSIKDLRDVNGKKIITYKEALDEAGKIKEIPYDQLTTAEQKVVDFLNENIMPIVSPRHNFRIKIFEPTGNVQARGISGLPIKLNRAELRSPMGATDVLMHEHTHNATSVDDADKDFRNYLTGRLAEMIFEVAELKGKITKEQVLGLIQGMENRGEKE